MEQSLLGWVLLLGLGFPLLGIILGELAHRLEQRKHPLAVGLQQIRQYLLPPLALLLVMRILLNIVKNNPSIQIVETLTWTAVIVAGISVLNALLTTQQQTLKWQIQVPNLFFQVARAGVVLSIGYYVINDIWHINLSGLITGVGVASAVIALALQDTLNNLVSGLLLLVAKPFQIGDWIEFDGKKARVVEMNWWSVTLTDPWGCNVNVPNGTLSKATVSNYSQEPVWQNISVGYSYDHPPNQVIAALNTLVEGIEDIETQGIAGVADYGDCAINYQLWYSVLPEKAWGVYNQLMARVYYLSERHGFSMPYPIAVQYNVDAKQGLPNEIPQVVENRQQELTNYLRSLPYFFSVDDGGVEQLADQAKFKTYGIGELITQEGKPDEGLYFVYKGKVQSSLTDQLGELQKVRELCVGEAFGEMALYPGEVSPVTVIAHEDVEIIVIPADEIVQLIQSNPKFATEIIQFIEERKKAILLAKGIQNTPHATIGNNGRRLQVRGRQ